jgi:hypothetical protein
MGLETLGQPWNCSRDHCRTILRQIHLQQSPASLEQARLAEESHRVHHQRHHALAIGSNCLVHGKG